MLAGTMFESGSIVDFSWFLFVIQQVSVPVATMIALILLAVPFEDVAARSRVAEIVGVLLAYACPPIIGWALGRVARKIGPTFRESGRGIWVAPVTLFVLVLAVSIFSDWRRALREMFMFTNEQPESGLAVVLLTFPAVACCFYSIGIGRRSTPEAS
jgi:hypothetical protein